MGLYEIFLLINIAPWMKFLHILHILRHWQSPLGELEEIASCARSPVVIMDCHPVLVITFNCATSLYSFLKALQVQVYTGNLI